MFKKLVTAFLAAAFLLTSPVQAAVFRDIGGTVLEMSGPISYTDDVVFNDTLTRGDYKVLVLRDSIGGSVDAALHIGETVAKLGIATVMKGYCYSACSYIWLAGMDHKYYLTNSIVGFHAPYSDKAAAKEYGLDDEEIIRETVDAIADVHWYFGRMGVSLETTEYFLSVSGDDIIIVDHSAFESYGIVATEIKEIPSGG